MKRIVLEWGLILSVGAFVLIGTVWIASVAPTRYSSQLKVLTAHSLAYNVHGQVDDGSAWFFNDFVMDASGTVRPAAEGLSKTVARKDCRVRRLTLPGFAVLHCRFIGFDYSVWSVRISLFFPVAFFLLSAVLFGRRLRKLRGSGERTASTGQTPAFRST